MSETIIELSPTADQQANTQRFSKKFIAAAMIVASVAGVASSPDNLVIGAESTPTISAANTDTPVTFEGLALDEPVDSTNLVPALRNPSMPYPIIAAHIETSIPSSVSDVLLSHFVSINGCSGSQIAQDIIVTSAHCIPHVESSQTVQSNLVQAYLGGKESGSTPLTATSVALLNETDTALLVLNGKEPNQAVADYFAILANNQTSVVDNEPIFFVSAPSGFNQLNQNHTPIVFQTTAIQDGDYSINVAYSKDNKQPVKNVVFTAGNLDQNGLGCIQGSSGALGANSNGEYVGNFTAPIPIKAGIQVQSNGVVSAEVAHANFVGFANLLKKVIYAETLCVFTKPAVDDPFTVLTVTK